MTKDDIKILLEEKNIECLEEISFPSKEEKLEFFSKIEKLEKENIKFDYLNKDLIEIISEMNTTKDNVDKLKKLNWQDFTQVFKEKDEDNRKKKIYDNFIHFLKTELNIVVEEKDKHSHQDKLFSKENISTDSFNQEKVDSSIFEKKKNFDTEKDTIEKAAKFDINIKFDYNEPSKKISVHDFTLYFNKRLQYFTNLLKNRIAMENVIRVSHLQELWASQSQVSLIGLVSEISQTKNRHYMITLEDKSGQVKCFIHKEKSELIESINNICLDEGIGINGKVGDNIIWTDEIIIPSPPNTSELKKTERDEYVVFLSDLHFGAKVFVDEAFQKLIDWLNGHTYDEKLNKLASKVKHIIIAGDIIEGIGIYPDQGKDARILSTEYQYHEAARWLSQIPQDKSLIIIPGNHDTERLSEPQPKLPYHKAYALYNMPNTVILSNPSRISLFEDDPSGGIDFMIYHGGSIFYYANQIQHLREKGGAKTPEEVVKFLLEKRHIAPSHGSTLYIPDPNQDPLVIKEMPDFFITGHTHKLSLANYKGCSIISCGCWVEMSDYQEKMGMYPDIGKCTIVNTKTRKPNILNFYTEKYKREN